MSLVSYIIIALVLGLIFGFATDAVIRGKGYNESWFGWGFFFGIIALIVACAKPENRNREDNSDIVNPVSYETENQIIETIKKYKELLDSGIITKEEFENKKKALLSSNIKKSNNNTTEQEILDGWTCTWCGKINPGNISVCSCGSARP